MPQEPKGYGYGGLPGAPDGTINLPLNNGFVSFEVFDTLNTKPPRPAIKESEMAWCDGFMPFGPSNIRTLYGIGANIYTAAGGLTITAFWFYNLDTNTYAAVLLSNGSLIQVHTVTGVATTILAAGTIQNPNPNQTWVTQWNAKYLVIVSNQTNGYWLWEGAGQLFTAGSISPTITITNGGSGYTGPTVTITGGSGSGAILSPTVVGGVITNIGVVTGGSGWLQGETISVAISDGAGTGATATATLMPFGIQGNTVEIYVNRVWVGNVRTGYLSAPADPSDFNPTDTAGSFQSNDSFQRFSYTSFRQTNGFLYLLSDSSMNYIGGVNVSGSPAITTFSNLNVDPQIGTPWPASVQLFSRNIVFANSFGIFVSYGGAVTKISTPLDGIYSTVVAAGNTVANIYPSSASASIFGIACYMMLLPIINPYTNAQENKLLMWDGKRWFTSPQDVTLTYISSQEINSVLTAWGTDGTHLYPLFQQPTTAFAKVVQSKLYANPSYWFNKTNPELAGILNFYNTTGTVSITVDNESGPSDAVTVTAISTATLTWTNNTGAEITWTNNAAQTITWGSPGIALVGPQTVGQVGVIMGFTVSTTARDVSILSLALLEQNFQSKV